MTKPTDEQQTKMAELRDLLAKEGLPIPFCKKKVVDMKEREEVTLYKILYARRWDLTQALNMCKEINKFREERQLDGMALFPAPKGFVQGFDEVEVNALLGLPPREPGGVVDQSHAAMSCCYAGAWHKTTKKGHPVYIERTGAVDVKSMVDILKSITKPGEDYRLPGLDSHIYCNEVGGAILDYVRLKSNTEQINTVVVISDLEGMGLGHLYKPALSLLELISQTDQKHYPEGLHALYLVNCPSMVTMAFNLIKGWLDPRVQSKIKFLKPHETAAALKEVIDVDSLPKDFGGNCSCPGGCVLKPTKILPKEHQGAAQTDRIQITAGQLATRYYPLKAGQVAAWDFCTESHNIAFEATFGTKKHVVHEKKKVECCHPETLHGTFEAKEDGILTLHFDNTYSWMHAKVVLLRMAIMEAHNLEQSGEPTKH